MKNPEILLLLAFCTQSFAATKTVQEAVNQGIDFAVCKFSFFKNGKFEGRWVIYENDDSIGMSQPKSSGKYKKDGENLILEVANKKDLENLQVIFNDSEGVDATR